MLKKRGQFNLFGVFLVLFSMALVSGVAINQSADVSNDSVENNPTIMVNEKSFDALVDPVLNEKMNMSIETKENRDLNQNLNEVKEKKNLDKNEVTLLNNSDDILSNQDSNEHQFEEIGEGLVYNKKSSIFKWVQSLLASNRSVFLENVKIYEEERKKNRGYYKQRDGKVNNISNDEPPFNPKICPASVPIDEETMWRSCSCGDGVCASYEDKCDCPTDCGVCPDNTVCRRGACQDYVESKCMNGVCDGGEAEVCPWDCRIQMIKESEEMVENPILHTSSIITKPEDVS